MIKHYFKTGFRNLVRNRGYTAINILGLATGIACCILIMLFVRSEWSFDRFHTKADRIYRAWLYENYEGQTFTNTLTPIPLGPAMEDNIPEVEATCRVSRFNTLIEHEGNRYNEVVNLADTNFFRLFDFKVLAGNPGHAFPGDHSIVLTQETATRYFGTEQPLGKTLALTMGDEQVLFTVSAIAANAPAESSIQFNLLIPHANDRYLYSERVRTSGWTSVFDETYILAKPGKTGKDLEAKIPALARKIAGDNYVAGQYNVYFQPITDIHLNKRLPAGNAPVSDPAYSYILGTIGILILLIACINFITLSVGRSATRALEVGVRKVMGADKFQLIRQFWGEALLLIVVAFAIGLGLALLLLSPFNAVSGKELTLAFDGTTGVFLGSLILVVAMVAGIYPAVILAGFSPSKVLKGSVGSNTGIGLFRKGLITGQFVASIVMIIGTFIIGRQLYFLQHKNLGYDKEHVVVIATNKQRSDGFPLGERFKESLSKNPLVAGATVSVFSFSEPGWAGMGYEDDHGVYRDFRMNAVDADFIPTMKLQIASGRNFLHDNSADIKNAMIINEAMAKEYGWTEPIGKKLPGSYEQKVIGVVKDFHFESLHNKIQPLALVLQPDSMFRHSSDVNVPFSTQPRISVRLRAGNLADQMAFLKKAWKSVAEGQDFDYRFLDDSLDAMYRDDQRLGTIVRWASFLSILIACMGLFGLATLIVSRRTREIGIRKVLGADVRSLVGLLSKDFAILVGVASVIAFPIAWWALRQWLQDFAYRIRISWWVFLLAALIALLIAMITVGFQAFRAALTNPVKTLRNE